MHIQLQHLKHCLATIPQVCYPVHSRVHALRSFNFPSTKCYVKRDDELGFGISGSKIRKYRSLIPFLVDNKVQEVVIIGSAYSNHVLSLVQLLIENGLQPTLFLRGDPRRSLQGNALLTSLFISPSAIHWFSQAQWKSVESQAYSYAQQQKHSTFVLPEGGCCPEALPGALTLVLDLLENEQEHNLVFDHIFIEAGTGFTASTLILGLNWLKHAACIHILLLADDEKAFLSRLKLCYEMFIQFMETSSPSPQNFVIHLPLWTKGFGQVNSSIFKTIVHLARKEGFLTDPIYSAKLFIESRYRIAQENIQGNILIHHSGGSLTLMGFQDQLQKVLKLDSHQN
jgi:1-aminocyclopropane-1-carboxylate deaminase